MEKNILEDETTSVKISIVIADECGDSMWDEVLEQSAFVQAVRLVSKTEPEDKKLRKFKA